MNAAKVSADLRHLCLRWRRGGGSTSFSTASILPVVKKHNYYTRRITELDKLVESGNDPGDYSFSTLSVGHKKLPVDLSAFCRSTYLSVERKVTTESDFDLQDVVV